MQVGATRGGADDGAFTSQPLALGGAALVADRSGALWWPAERMLIVADLHLEKGSAYACRGLMLPPYDTRETLARLGEAITRFGPRTVVALGDSLHDRGAAERLGDDDRACLAALQRGRSWVWVTGNHDPEIDPDLGGEAMAEVFLGGIALRHIPGERPGEAVGAVGARDMMSVVGPGGPGDAEAAGGAVGAVGPEIAGHLHPAARLHTAQGVLRRPCFAGDGARLVLPAFGAFTGGLNVLDPAFAAVLAPERLRVLMLGRDGVYPVPTRQLGPD